MEKVIIKCECCGKKKRITKRHKRIIGNQCMECFHKESLEERMQQIYNDLY